MDNLIDDPNSASGKRISYVKNLTYAEYNDALLKRDAEIERLQQFVDFVNIWCWRETKISDGERLSAIKYHPTARERMKTLNEQLVCRSCGKPADSNGTFQCRCVGC